MKFSLVLTTRRDIEALKPLFLVSDKDTEIIIIDTNYNDKTKQELSSLKHDYYKVTYAPPMELKYMIRGENEISFKRDLVHCHNTGFAYAENDWIIKVDDSTEFQPDFFKNIRDDIKELSSQTIGVDKFVIRPIKLEEWMGHKKWEQYPILKQLKIPIDTKYIDLDREGIGQGLFVTLDQAVFTRNSIDDLNGNDERYDIGHGMEDVDLMQRFITFGYNIILDQQLMTFQYKHKIKIDPFNFSRLLYEFNHLEILNGKYRAYNPYDIKSIRPQMLELKKQYEIQKEDNRSPSEVFSGLAIYPTNYVLPETAIKYAEDGNLVINRRDCTIASGLTFSDLNKPNYFKGEYLFDKYFTKEELDENNKKILALKDYYKGGELFILGNSPDITREFINKIRGKTTFAANGFIVMKDKWDYEPTYMVVTNQGTFDNHLRNMIPEFKEYEGGSVSELFQTAKKTKFILSDLILKPVLLNHILGVLDGLPCKRTQERINFLKQNTHIRVLNREEVEPPYMIHTPPTEYDISFNLLNGTFMCGTVITDLMLPLASWMGFKNIYLKGCSGGAGHFYDIAPRHFWDFDKQKHMYVDIYAIFKKLLDERGINIYNLDRPTPFDLDADSMSKQVYNPTKTDGHFWDGPIIHHTLGKEPYIIEYKSLEEIC